MCKFLPYLYLFISLDRHKTFYMILTNSSYTVHTFAQYIYIFITVFVCGDELYTLFNLCGFPSRRGLAGDFLFMGDYSHNSFFNSSKHFLQIPVSNFLLTRNFFTSVLTLSQKTHFFMFFAFLNQK